jgi:hypothetical protein
MSRAPRKALSSNLKEVDLEQPQVGFLPRLSPAAASAYSAGLAVDEAPVVEDLLAAAFFSTMLTAMIEPS